MKIFVLNLIGKRMSRAIAGVLVVIVALSVTIGLLATNYGEELLIYAQSASQDEKIIIIDAGHGGEDPGAVGDNGILEKDINLDVALEMGSIFEEKGYVVVYTRTDDRLLYTEAENIKGIRKISDLKNRCKFAAKYPSSLFISVHMNSFGDSKYSGTQVYYKEGNEGSKMLADTVQNRVKKDLQHENNRKIKSGKDIYVLNNISNDAILIECGFLTNKDECKKLSEKEYQKQLSLSIVCGIIEYMENKK